MNALPPPPMMSDIANNGKVHPSWAMWFTKIFEKQRITASGTFTTVDGKTVTVTDGIIVKIV